MRLERSQIIPAGIDEVWAFFSNPHNLARITPDSMSFSIVDAPERDLKLHDVIHYRLRVAGIPIRWVSEITEWNEGVSFVDLQIRGPYRLWHHRHSFEQTPDGIRMTDEVDYELPLGALGELVAGWFVERQLEQIFAHRERVICETFDHTPGSS